jgi:hypothetical protein
MRLSRDHPMTEPITTEEQITPDWLTNVLRRNGHLVQGDIITLNKESFKALFSLFYSIEAHYSNDANPTLHLGGLLAGLSALSD